MTSDNRRKRRVERARLYLSRQPQWIQDAINGNRDGWHGDEVCVDHQLRRMFRFPPGHYRRLLSAERALKGVCTLNS